MKIDNSIKTTSPVTGSTDAQGRPGRTQGGTAGEAASADSVSLSPLSSQLQALESSLANSEVVDTQRVAEIKQAISDGKFTVNPEVVADKLIEQVREMLQAHKA